MHILNWIQPQYTQHNISTQATTTLKIVTLSLSLSRLVGRSSDALVKRVKNKDLELFECKQTSRTITPDYLATWKSPKSSSGTSCCSLFSSPRFFSTWGDSSFSRDLCGLTSGEIPNGGLLSGESTGERGGGGGGGSRIPTEASLFLDLSSNERLFRRCSKNLDLMLPPSFCWVQKERRHQKIRVCVNCLLTRWVWEYEILLSWAEVLRSPRLLNYNRLKKNAGIDTPSLLQFSSYSDTYRLKKIIWLEPQIFPDNWKMKLNKERKYFIWSWRAAWKS